MYVHRICSSVKHFQACFRKQANISFIFFIFLIYISYFFFLFCQKVKISKVSIVILYKNKECNHCFFLFSLLLLSSSSLFPSLQFLSKRAVIQVKKMTSFRKFCYLNSSCIRKRITLMCMSFSQENSVTDVSVGFRPPCWSSSS